MLHQRLILSFSLILLFFSSQSYAVLVDNFDDPATLQDNTIGGGDFGPAATGLTTPANSDFANRSFELNITASTGGNVELRAAASILNVNKSVNSRAVLRTVWSGGVVDFTTGGHDRLNFILAENDLPVILKFRATDNAANTGYYNHGALPFVIAGSPLTQSVFWDLVNWTANEDGTGGNVAIDFTQITAFELIIDSSAFINGSDTQLDIIETVGPPPGTPEPVPTIGEWGMILLLLAFMFVVFKEHRRQGC